MPNHAWTTAEELMGIELLMYFKPYLEPNFSPLHKKEEGSNEKVFLKGFRNVGRDKRSEYLARKLLVEAVEKACGRGKVEKREAYRVYCELCGRKGVPPLSYDTFKEHLREFEKVGWISGDYHAISIVDPSEKRECLEYKLMFEIPEISHSRYKGRIEDLLLGKLESIVRVLAYAAGIPECELSLGGIKIPYSRADRCLIKCLYPYSAGILLEDESILEELIMSIEASSKEARERLSALLERLRTGGVATMERLIEERVKNRFFSTGVAIILAALEEEGKISEETVFVASPRKVKDLLGSLERSIHWGRQCLYKMMKSGDILKYLKKKRRLLIGGKIKTKRGLETIRAIEIDEGKGRAYAVTPNGKVLIFKRRSSRLSLQRY